MCHRAEEDLPDQKIAIVEACRTGECAKKWGLYTSCVSRVEDPSNPRGISKDPEANCTSWYLDFWKCADKCVSAARQLPPNPVLRFLPPTAAWGVGLRCRYDLETGFTGAGVPALELLRSLLRIARGLLAGRQPAVQGAQVN